MTERTSLRLRDVGYRFAIKISSSRGFGTRFWHQKGTRLASEQQQQQQRQRLWRQRWLWRRSWNKSAALLAAAVARAHGSTVLLPAAKKNVSFKKKLGRWVWSTESEKLAPAKNIFDRRQIFPRHPLDADFRVKRIRHEVKMTSAVLHKGLIKVTNYYIIKFI